MKPRVTYGGVEISNFCKTMEYIKAGWAGASWDRCRSQVSCHCCDGTADPDLGESWWFDPTNPCAREFLGVLVEDVVYGDAYTRPVRNTINGGRIGAKQMLVRDITLEGFIVAASEGGTEYGLDALNAIFASGKETAIGKSVAGNTTKIHMAVDSYGLPIHFTVTGGEVHDAKEAPNLIASLPKVDYVIADRGYDSQSLRDQIINQGATPVLPRKRNTTVGNDDIDWCLYRYRHLVENVFARLKHYRAIATRYDKLKRNFHGVLALACVLLWLPM